MTKIRKQQRKKRFRANVNRKRLRNKLQKLPKIECDEIENSWELKRSIRTNLKDMGLAYDPNEVLKIPSTKRGIVKIAKKNQKLDEEGEEEEEEEEAAENNEDEDENSKSNGKILREKIHVANKLEADAKAPRERMFRLPNSQVQFVTYLMEKYGDDYKAMARDRKNHYQMTWCQIRAKINTFKSIPEQYAEYLLKSGEIVLDDPTPLSETRRKLGEENLKKYCVPKKRKIPQEPKKPLWDVESVEDENEEFCTDDNESSNKKNKSQSDSGLKKLKLFSDDEESDGEKKTRSTKKKSEASAPIEINNKAKESKKTKANSVSLKPKQNVDKKLKKADNSKQDLTARLKKLGKVEKSQSSDSDSEDFEELDGDEGEEADGFVNLSDMSEEELSEDDVLDDGEFVTDSDESD